jgi:hypothetical protein
MNYATIAKIYCSKIRPRAQSELDWFRKQSTLGDAITNAALAKNSEGKRYSHQRRLKRSVLEQAKDILLGSELQIGKVTSFDELLSIIEDDVAGIKGIGELYVYDTALRIGAWLSIIPRKIYLHAGTRQGAKVLGIDHRARAIDISELPRELAKLAPHEIEDILCIFKDELSTILVEDVGNKYKKRSWCY